MRLSNCALLLGTAVLLSSTSAMAQTVVETFSGSRTYNHGVPGTPDGSGGVDFTYSSNLNTLSFTPGSVTFNGQPVDFSGTEASFLATSHSGTANIPVLSGPATVNTTGTANWAGPALNSGGDRDQINLRLGPTFSPSSLDVLMASDYDALDRLLSWNSTVVPELNGFAVNIETTETVTAVDPANGTVNVSFIGQIVAFQNPAVPATSPFGLWVLGFSVLGLGLMFLRRHG